MGLIEGITPRKLRIMSKKPLVSEMRKIYGRPTLRELLNATNLAGSKTFLVKRDPFQRLFSGYKNKILGAVKGSHHDKMSQKILQAKRGLAKRDYKFKLTVPTFAEFVDYVLDNYQQEGDIDMHWAPVVDFCSVCKVTTDYQSQNTKESIHYSSQWQLSHYYVNLQVNYSHVLDFDHLYADMEQMLPTMKDIFAQHKLKNVRLNANRKSPVTEDYIKSNLQSLGPQLYQRLCSLYQKDFKVFGYEYPTFESL